MLKTSAAAPYPPLHGVTTAIAKKPSYQIEVQRRPLSAYTQAVR